MLLEILHKAVRRLPLPFSRDRVRLSEINFIERPDIFMAYEWIMNGYRRDSLYCEYTGKFTRKGPDIDQAEKKMKKLHKKMKFEYMYLFRPVEFYAAPDGYIGLNIHRLSILLALGYKVIPCRILDDKSVAPSTLNKIKKRHYISRVRKQLGDETDKVLDRIMAFVDGGNTTI